jgi:hypothetical protein
MIVTKLNLTHRETFRRMLEDYDAHVPVNGETRARGDEINVRSN